MTQYRIREKRFSIGDDFWVETVDGERAFKIDGKGSRRPGTFLLESVTGDELFTINPVESDGVGPIEITRGTQRVAAVTKEVAGTHHYAVEVEAGDDLSVTSNPMATEPTFALAGATIARVSNHWLTPSHTFEVEIESGQDHALILAVIVAIDWLSRT